MERKSTGSYYTPNILSQFLVNHIFLKYRNGIRDFKVLEPSCGDGKFIEPIIPYITEKGIKLDLIEIDSNELKKSKKRIPKSLKNKVNTFNQDFLKHEFKTNYSLIIGNPPYISKKYLSDEQIGICKKICQPIISGEVKNIWPAFLVKSIDSLTEDGIICFILPSELLQVKYTSGLRKLILNSFDRVEVFAFNELIFENAEQDVVAIIGIKNHNIQSEKGVSFYQVDQLNDLTIPDYTEMNFNVHREKLDKWTNYILTDSQLSKVDFLSNQLKLKSIDYYTVKAEVGIVTAANDFFIKTENDVKILGLKNYAKPILQKSSVLKNTIIISPKLIELLKKKNIPINLITFRNKSKNSHSFNARKYISYGEDLNIHERYKMKKRINWFHVPGIWDSQALFAKRSHEFPRMFLNDANILVTDSFYRVNCKEEFDPKSLVFSFYNSLTLVLAELEGRFYGGGVLELIPTEFKSLVIPYKNIDKNQFSQLQELFAIGATLEEILNFTDPILLSNVSNSDVNLLREIRQTLFSRRTKLNKKDEELILEFT